MGGAITVIYRTENGWLSKLHWTNGLNYRFCNLSFINKDNNYIENLLSEPDYMHDGNADEPIPFAPEEYGIIVCDLVENKILSASDYEYFGSFQTVDITHPNGIYSSNNTPRAPHDKIIVDLWNEHRIKEIIIREIEDGEAITKIQKIKDDITLDDLADELDRMYDQFFSDSEEEAAYPWRVAVDTNPFVIEVNGTKCSETLKKIRSYLIEKGCPQLVNDEKLWDLNIGNCLGFEEELLTMLNEDQK